MATFSALTKAILCLQLLLFVSSGASAQDTTDGIAETPAEPLLGFLAVQGVVYCKPTCQYAGVDTVWGAGPLPGATVKMICSNTREFIAQTDPNGYFYMEAPVNIFDSYSCQVKLLSSPSPMCPVPGPLHSGNTGSPIHLEKLMFDFKRGPYPLFRVGPLAFEPPKCYKN